jgi:hypothetical protein
VTGPGTGGLPVPRAIDQQVSYPPAGVQPGSAAGIVRARLVIVSGTDEGVFVYSGTPALGNPPIAAMCDSFTDPFGNAVVPGVSSQLPGQGIAELFGGVIQLYADAAQAGHQALIEAAPAGTLELTSGGQGPTDTSTVANLLSGLSGGVLQVVSGADGNTYDTQQLTLTTAGASINSTSRVVVFSVPLAVGTYEVNVWAVIANSTPGDAATWSFAGTGGLAAASAGTGMDFQVTLAGSPGVVDYGAASNYVTAFSNNSSAGDQRLDMRLTIVVTTAGTLTWGGVENNAGNPVAVASGSQMTVCPVTGTTGTGGSSGPGGGGFGKLLFLVPSGDPTGVMDADALAAAYTAGKTPVLTPGAWYVKAGVVVLGAGQSLLRVGGPWDGSITGVGTGDVIRAVDTTLAYLPGGGKIEPYVINMTGMGSGSSGVHAGDLYNLDVDIYAENAPAGCIGIWFDNQYLFTEQLHGRVWAHACATCVQFDNSTGTTLSADATGSFDRADIDIYLDAKNAGNGVVFTNGAIIVDGHLGVRGNFDTSNAAQYSVLEITGSNATNGASLLARSRIDVGVELNALGGTFTPQTLTIGTIGSNGIFGCSGLIDYAGSANVFTPAGATVQPSFQFDGPVYGDADLMATTGTGLAHYDAGGSLVTGGTILTRFNSVYRCQPAGNITGIILETPPPFTFLQEESQTITVVNNSAFTITFDVVGTSHVADGNLDVIAANTAATFIWDYDAGTWYRSY